MKRKIILSLFLVLIFTLTQVTIIFGVGFDLNKSDSTDLEVVGELQDLQVVGELEDLQEVEELEVVGELEELVEVLDTTLIDSRILELVDLSLEEKLKGLEDIGLIEIEKIGLDSLDILVIEGLKDKLIAELDNEGITGKTDINREMNKDYTTYSLNSLTSTLNDSLYDTNKFYEDITKLDWGTDKKYLNIDVSRLSYYIEGTFWDYLYYLLSDICCDYDNYGNNIVKTDYGYLKLDHRNRRIQYMYNSYYEVEIITSDNNTYKVNSYYDIYKEKLTVKIYKGNKKVYDKEYSNVSASIITHIEIPLSKIGIKAKQGGYELDFFVSSNSDRCPDSIYITISSIPTIGVYFTILLIVFLILLSYRELKLNEKQRS